MTYGRENCERKNGERKQMLRVERLTRMSETRSVHAQIGPLILWWRERFARAGGSAARYPQHVHVVWRA